MHYEFSIIIPCLNEENNIYQILNDLTIILKKYKYEIIVVDDNSDDLTVEKATNFIEEKKFKNIKIIRRNLDRRGYGAVIRHGIAYASAKYCIPVSADRVDPIEIIPKFIEKVGEGYSIVQCSRYLNNENSNSIPFIYKFYQYFFRKILKIITKKNYTDTTYAFKIFDRKKAISFGLTLNRFSISPEIFLKFYLANEKIAFVSASQGKRVYGISKFKFIKEGPGFIYVLLRTFLHKYRIIFWF